jgi:hypothetical protein
MQSRGARNSLSYELHAHGLAFAIADFDVQSVAGFAAGLGNRDAHAATDDKLLAGLRRDGENEEATSAGLRDSAQLVTLAIEGNGMFRDGEARELALVVSHLVIEWDHFPISSLAMVSNCMLEVPS